MNENDLFKKNDNELRNIFIAIGKQENHENILNKVENNFWSDLLAKDKREKMKNIFENDVNTLEASDNTDEQALYKVLSYIVNKQKSYIQQLAALEQE